MDDLGPSRSRIWLIAAVALAGITLFAWFQLPRFEPAEPVVEDEIPRIVVLPLANLGAPEDAYFASGMTEDLTTRLAAVRGLGVISRSSAIQYDRTGKTARQVGEDLGVDFLLEGDVHRRRGADGADRVLLAPRLSRVSDGSTLWSERHERALEEVFDLQSAIAGRVTQTLGITLSESEQRILNARPTGSMEAYDTFLQALSYCWSFEQRELEQAEELLEQSVTLDPNFAAAHAMLSENHSLLFHFRYDRSPQRLASARAAAERALELEPDLPEGHRAMGYFYYWGHRNYEMALSKFIRAAQGRPSDSVTVASIAVVHRRQGQWEESIEELKKAAEMDPRSDENVLDLASSYGRVRDFGAAVKHCRQAIEMAPDDIYPYVYCARINRARDGSTQAARDLLDSMPDKDPAQQSYYRFEQAVYERDYDTAIDWLKSTSDVISEPIDEEILTTSLAECHCRMLQGASRPPESCENARVHFERARDASPGDAAIHGALGWTYALLGRKEEAIEAGQRAVMLLPIEEDAMAGQTHLERLAKIYARVGEHELAIDTIEESLDNPGWLTAGMLRLDPDWDPLREHPRFIELVAPRIVAQ